MIYNVAASLRQPLCVQDSKVQKVRAVLRSRTARSILFGTTLFDEPGWEILLHLYAAHFEHREMLLAELISSSTCPASTVTRWARVLEKERLVTQTPGNDVGPVVLRLTEDGLASMHALFEVIPNVSF